MCKRMHGWLTQNGTSNTRLMNKNSFFSERDYFILFILPYGYQYAETKRILLLISATAEEF